MKEFALVQGGDFIIHYDLRVIFEKDGKTPKITNEDLGLSEHRKSINSISLYCHEKDHNGYNTEKAIQVWMNPDGILQLAEKIKAMRNELIETYYEPLDDLPF